MLNALCILVFSLYHILRLDFTVVINVSINSSCLLLKIKQPNPSLKYCCVLHEYAFELTSSPKWTLICKFCNCWLRGDKWLMVDTHCRIAKHQRGSFHETESSQTFFKHAIPDFCSYFLFHFNRTKILNLSVWFLIFYMNMLCITYFSWKRKKKWRK